MKEANHAAKHVEDKGARVSIGGKCFSAMVEIVECQLFRLNSILANIGLQARVASYGKVGSIAILHHNKTGLPFIVAHARVVEVRLWDSAIDSYLPRSEEKSRHTASMGFE